MNSVAIQQIVNFKDCKSLPQLEMAVIEALDKLPDNTFIDIGISHTAQKNKDYFVKVVKNIISLSFFYPEFDLSFSEDLNKLYKTKYVEPCVDLEEKQEQNQK